MSSPDGIALDVRRRALDTLRDLNQLHLQDAGDPEIATRIAAYEMAYRMQTSVPELQQPKCHPEQPPHLPVPLGFARGTLAPAEDHSRTLATSAGSRPGG